MSDDFLSRLRNERDQLSLRLFRLDEFLTSPGFLDNLIVTDRGERERLKLQRSLMDVLLQVLNSRINFHTGDSK